MEIPYFVVVSRINEQEIDYGIEIWGKSTFQTIFFLA